MRQIKNYCTDAVIFEGDGEIKEVVAAAVTAKADLSWANLIGADLSWANLSGANLSWANLIGADLIGADLSRANFSGANLIGANLSRANLIGADLSGANLRGANLSRTILDPRNQPNALTKGFEEQEGWLIGYRTRTTSAAGLRLQDDRIYGTEVFSTDETECHPGWYLWPTLEASREFSSDETEFIRVRARKCDIHKAGSKWRSRAIWVVGGVD